MNIDQTMYSHILPNSPENDSFDKLHYIYVMQPQVWGRPKATEHTKECHLPRRLGC